MHEHITKLDKHGIPNIFSFAYLNQQGNWSSLVYFQDLSVLSSHQDVAVAQSYAPYGRVILQEQP